MLSNPQFPLHANPNPPTAPEWLRFVESEERYSVYVDRDGEEWYIAHGPGRRVLVQLDEMPDLNSMWQRWIWAPMDQSQYDWSGFVEWVNDSLTDDEDFDMEHFQCATCRYPAHDDDMHTIDHDSSVCRDCIEDAWLCSDCNCYFSSTTTTGDDTEVCSRCLHRNWTFCDHCDAYRHDEDYEHYHSNASCDCESPAQVFTMSTTTGALHANERRVVEIPAGQISERGIHEIGQLLRTHSYMLDREVQAVEATRYRMVAHDVEREFLGNRWRTNEGTLAKRIARHAYKEHGIKISNEMISQIGNIAEAQSRGATFDVAITRDLNLSPEQFAHEGSCWWSDHAESRCALKSNGGFGLRAFGDEAWNGIEGRAWVMPLNVNLEPTFDTLSAEAFVVFNGYGTLNNYSQARIMAELTGMSYCKIEFRSSPMYINSDAGYLIAPAETIAEVKNEEGYASLYLSLEEHSDLYNREQVAA